ISSVLPKMRLLRKVYAGDIAVDGGITEATAKLAIKAGANILDAGTYIFKAPDLKSAVQKLREAECKR
ncbi:MAG: ribulose-phosphate 3-epimerase, partial [Candidatus Omnitrophica bacterium]|nr:ribulose-phosphate 3-epimerase [Candidatus Omnitrophota bacterium]